MPKNKSAPVRAAQSKAPKMTRQQRLLAEAVAAAGSQTKLAKKLDCSQQSVSAWLKGDVPRGSMQRTLKKMFNIPTPWAAT